MDSLNDFRALELFRHLSVYKDEKEISTSNKKYLNFIILKEHLSEEKTELIHRASIKEISKFVEHSLTSKNLTNEEKIEILKGYECITNRYRKKQGKIYFFLLSYLLGQAHDVDRATGMISDGLVRYGSPLQEGEGTVKSEDGTIFRGEFKRGELVKGKITHPDGSFEEGCFRKGKLEGEGILNRSNEIIYQGFFDRGEIKRGKKTLSDGTILEGTFKEGQLIEGTKIGSDQAIYSGTFADEKLIKGAKTQSNGIIYRGYFEDEKLIRGSKNEPDGVIQRGIFKDEKLMRFENSLGVYQGDFERGQFIQGTFTSTDGIISEGRFKNRLLIEGTITFPDGTIYTGKFKDNNLIDGIMTNPYHEKVELPKGFDVHQWYTVYRQLGVNGQQKGKNQDYIDYQRKLIFGFSMGQRSKLEILEDDPSLLDIDLSSVLQESDPLIHMTYISRYLKAECAKGESDHLDSACLKALTKLDEDLTRSMSFASSSSLNDSDDLSQRISDELIKLNSGERLLIPTGSRYHATLLVLEKKSDGEIRPILYNTGFGLEHQLGEAQVIERSGKKMYRKGPVSISYPSINLGKNKERFESMMVKIFETGNEDEMGGIYDALEKGLGKGTPGKPRKIQMNGVCSFQCLSAAFKDILGSSDYLDFKLGLLTHIQEEFEELTEEIKLSNLGDRKSQAMNVLHQKLLEDNALAIGALKIKKSGFKRMKQ